MLIEALNDMVPLKFYMRTRKNIIQINHLTVENKMCDFLLDTHVLRDWRRNFSATLFAAAEFSINQKL